MSQLATNSERHWGGFVDAPESTGRVQVPAHSLVAPRPLWFPLAALWRGLTEGQLQICCDSAELGYVRRDHVLRIAEVLQAGVVTSACESESLSHYLRGEPNKSLAMVAKLAASSVSRQHARALERMGFLGLPCRAPVLLALAARAAAGAPLPHAAIEWQSGPSGAIMRLSFPRVDAGLSSRLSPKVLEALNLFIDGKTHKQIAANTGRSKNTIGNQLRTASQVLAASGRFDLIARLVEQRGRGQCQGVRPRASSRCAQRGCDCQLDALVR